MECVAKDEELQQPDLPRVSDDVSNYDDDGGSFGTASSVMCLGHRGCSEEISAAVAADVIRRRNLKRRRMAAKIGSACNHVIN